VERAAKVLRAVAAATGPAGSATALAESVGLNRTTTWRILSTLEHEQLVRLDRETGWYSLGFGLLDLAGQAAGTSLAQSSRRVLQRLAAQTGETAALAVMRDGALTYVAEAGAGSVVSAGWQGRSVALHATSTGKAFLACCSDEEVRRLLGVTAEINKRVRLPRYTDTTITSLSELTDALATTRAQGYGTCRGEFESSAWGVSAPVLNASGVPLAVVSVWGPSERLTDDRFPALGEVAVEAAGEIGR
jgi:DNA-binding IclR family transcriptional regulator